MTVARVDSHEAREEDLGHVDLGPADAGSHGGASEVNDDDVGEGADVAGHGHGAEEGVGVVLLGVEGQGGLPLLGPSVRGAPNYDVLTSPEKWAVKSTGC